MRVVLIGVLIGVAAALLTAACGQKGPLYLPDKTAKVIIPPPAPTPPAASKKNNDKDEETPPPPQ